MIASKPIRLKPVTLNGRRVLQLVRISPRHLVVRNLAYEFAYNDPQYPDHLLGGERTWLLGHYGAPMRRAIIRAEQQFRSEGPGRTRLRAMHTAYRGRRR